MPETNFKKLVDRLKALAPICNFGMPEILCGDDELYFRGLHDRTDKEISLLVNLASGATNDQVS